MKQKYFPYRFLLLAATATFTFITYTDRICLSTAKNQIMNDLGISLTQLGWIMAAFTLGYAVTNPLYGRIADKFGPRNIFTIVAASWTVFTAFAGLTWNTLSLFLARLFLGAGEAGTYPTLSKVTLNWYPVKERGIVQGVNFSGSRLGGAVALFLSAWLIGLVGWRYTFLIYASFGLLYTLLWFLIFRNKPEQTTYVSEEEKAYIMANRQQVVAEQKKLPFSTILKTSNMRWAMIQYIGSCFIFFFTLTWMYPYIKEKFEIDAVNAGLYSALPLIAGALGNWVSGSIVDILYKKYSLNISRKVSAIGGFMLAGFGMYMVIHSSSIEQAILFLSIAVFGADATLSPSWAFCIDIGKQSSGTVSALMNMAGNVGAVVTAISYPYFVKLTGSPVPFFYTCILLAFLAIFAWMKMDATKTIQS